MKKIIIIFLLFSLSDTQAQVNQEWVATYSGVGTGYNFPKKSAIDGLGNFIVAGNSDDGNDYDYIILKYNSGGSLIWSQRYNGIGNSYDYLIGMVLDDSDNVYVTGASDEGVAQGGVNWLTIKYNSAGVMQWKKSLNWIANGVDEPFGMNIDKERNIYVIGYGKTSSVNRQMITIKYNTNGDSIWTKVYRTNLDTHDWRYSVVTDDSLNVYSSGYGVLPTGNEIVTIKYDSDGNEIWIERYPTYYGDFLRPTFSAVDKENNLIVVGYSYISNDYDFVTLKYNTAGEVLWSRIYDGGNIDRANALFIDSYSNILIAGFTYQNTEGDFLILKYKSNGDTLLIKNINGEDPTSTDEAFSILSDSAGNIYVTGYSQSSSFRYDYLTVKLTSDGHGIWSKNYRTLYDNYSYCLNLDKNRNIFVSGESFLPNGSTGIVTIKYSQLTGINLGENTENNNYQLNNYPNPFNPNTQINFQIPKDGFIKIIVYDISGREIETLVNEQKNKGQYKINFNGDRYSSGVYFYSLISNGIIVKSNKMIIMK